MNIVIVGEGVIWGVVCVGVVWLTANLGILQYLINNDISLLLHVHIELAHIKKIE